MGETIEAAPKKPRLALLLATGFGLGYLPIAPGTWGSLGGVLAAWCLSNFWAFSGQIRDKWTGFEHVNLSFETDPPWMWIPLMRLPEIVGTILAALIGVWASRHAARYFGKSDPGQIVIDEISGQQITYLPLGALSFAGGGWKYVLLGFILFRVFDIVKPPPARQAERWPHGWGIMADDWFAGLYAAIVLWAVHQLKWLGG
ncbi:MAG: phosphatidylglycerophosphatase A [Acidobacteria bacterium]|nr:phosphatidylglycerophosphatase A [Acidobacteriota bacterium]